MFAPRPAVAVQELIRVVGGRIAFTTWPPEHAIGRMFARLQSTSHLLPTVLLHQ